MTAITITAPSLVRGRARRVARPAVRPVAACRPTARPATQVRPAPSGTLHLTRRGRVVVVALVLAVVAVLSCVAGGVALGGSAPTHVTTRTVTVQPGDTLWSIAASVAPHDDPRDTIARLSDLNALHGTQVTAGERLVVPAR